MLTNTNIVDDILIYVHSTFTVSAAIRLLKTYKYKKAYIVANRGAAWPIDGGGILIESADNYVMNDYDHLIRITKFICKNGPLEVFLPHSFSLVSFALHRHEQVPRISYIEEGEGTYTAINYFNNNKTPSQIWNASFKIKKLQRFKWLIYFLSIILPVKKATNKMTAFMIHLYFGLYQGGFIDFTNKKFGAVWLTDDFCPSDGAFMPLESIKIKKTEQQSKALVMLLPFEIYEYKEEQILKIIDKTRKSLCIDQIVVKRHPGSYTTISPPYMAYFSEELKQQASKHDIAYWAYENGYRALIVFGSSSLFNGALISRYDQGFITLDLHSYLVGEESSGLSLLKEINEPLAEYIRTDFID